MNESERSGSFVSTTIAAYIRSIGRVDAERDFYHLPIIELESVATALLKPSRVAHVLGCRDTAVALAKRWGADETDAARAALLHDITKVFDGPAQLTLADEYGIILDGFSRENPKTLHALTGAAVARRMFGERESVVRAIASHTTGKPNMNTLEMILYVADYMEPNRDFPGVRQLRELAFSDLELALRRGLEMTLEHLHEQGAQVSPASSEALQFLYQKTMSTKG